MSRCIMQDCSPRVLVLLANFLKVIQSDVNARCPCPEPCADMPFSDFEDPPPAPAVSIGAEMECLAYLPEDLKNLTLPAIAVDVSASAAIDIIIKDLQEVSETPQYSITPHYSVTNTEIQTSCPPTTQPTLFDNLNNLLDSSSAAFPSSNNNEELINSLILAASNAPSLPEIPVDWDTCMLDASAEPTCEMTDNFRPLQEIPASPMHSLFGRFEITRSSYLNGISLNDRFMDIDTSVFEKEISGDGSTTTQLPPPEDVWIEPYCTAPSCNLSKSVKDSNELDHIMGALVGY
ncbi:SERTA domain-containing protein 2-like [Pelobates fuscus]|uniref:SERTA domain-containing protein 2-like n=1 Tax=Pelobates fuscus TaxID=191477 RepID=UPI002FE4DD3A